MFSVTKNISTIITETQLHSVNVSVLITPLQHINNFPSLYSCSPAFPLYLRIPLVPRRPVSPDAAASGTGAKPKPEKGGKQQKVPSKEGCDEPATPPPADPDERLLYDAYMMGVSSIEAIVSTWM